MTGGFNDAMKEVLYEVPLYHGRTVDVDALHMILEAAMARASEYSRTGRQDRCDRMRDEIQFLVLLIERVELGKNWKEEPYG